MKSNETSPRGQRFVSQLEVQVNTLEEENALLKSTIEELKRDKEDLRMNNADLRMQVKGFRESGSGTQGDSQMEVDSDTNSNTSTQQLHAPRFKGEQVNGPEPSAPNTSKLQSKRPKAPQTTRSTPKEKPVFGPPPPPPSTTTQRQPRYYTPTIDELLGKGLQFVPEQIRVREWAAMVFEPAPFDSGHSISETDLFNLYHSHFSGFPRPCTLPSYDVVNNAMYHIETAIPWGEGEAVPSIDSSPGTQLTGKRKLDTLEACDEVPNTNSVKKSKRAPPSAEELEALRIANVALTVADAALAAGSSSFPGKTANLEAIQIPFNLNKVFSLPKAEIQALLADSPNVVVSPPARTIFVRQHAFGVLYRCTSEGIVQVMPAETNPYYNVQRMIVHLQPKDHPAMPLFPGHSGILLGSLNSHFNCDKGTWTVFRKLGHANGNGGGESVYLGEYKVEIVGQMTKEQFCAQNSSVQHRQAKEMSRSTRLGLLRMQARIALRRDGVLPVSDTETECKILGEEMGKMRKKQGRSVTEGELIQSLRRGDEVSTSKSSLPASTHTPDAQKTFDIVRMQFIEYDHKFINHIEVAMDAWKQEKRKAKDSQNFNLQEAQPQDTNSTVPENAIANAQTDAASG
ncbi:hypothetical protein NMY22_g11043 [Coprinellus aureogranulatus]|nr:hypothetical protein NMY22_g11043 [Coprinellus aureogranulatus]